MSISDGTKVPVDSIANVHSVSAVGEQYLDLVSPGEPNKYFAAGQTITKGTVPSEIGPSLDAVGRGLSALPADKIPVLLNETAQAVGGLVRLCSAWSTVPRPSWATSRPTSMTSTASSTIQGRSSTVRLCRPTRSRRGRRT